MFFLLRLFKEILDKSPSVRFQKKMLDDEPSRYIKRLKGNKLLVVKRGKYFHVMKNKVLKVNPRIPWATVFRRKLSNVLIEVKNNMN